MLRSWVHTTLFTIRDSLVVIKHRTENRKNKDPLPTSSDTHMIIHVRWFLVGLPLDDFVYSMLCNDSGILRSDRMYSVTSQSLESRDIGYIRKQLSCSRSSCSKPAGVR